MEVALHKALEALIRGLSLDSQPCAYCVKVVSCTIGTSAYCVKDQCDEAKPGRSANGAVDRQLVDHLDELKRLGDVVAVEICQHDLRLAQRVTEGG